MCHHRMWKANRRYVELRSQQFLKFDMFQRSRPLYKSPHLTVLNKRQILRFYFPSWNPNFLTDDHWNPWVLVSIWNWVLAKIFYPEVFDNRKSRTDNQVDIFPWIFYSNVQEFALTWQGHFSYSFSKSCLHFSSHALQLFEAKTCVWFVAKQFRKHCPRSTLISFSQALRFSFSARFWNWYWKTDLKSRKNSHYKSKLGYCNHHNP